MRIQTRIAAAAFAVAAAGACASTQTAGDTEPIPIVVDNSNGPLGGISVYLVPENGVRDLLGTVVGSGVDTLYYDGLAVSRLYRLVGDPPAASDVVSTTFTLSRGELVRWDVGLNSVWVLDRTTGERREP